MKRIVWLAILIMAFLIQAGSSGLAQTDKSGMMAKVNPGKSGMMSKVNRDLVGVYNEYTTYQAQGGPGVFTSKNPLMRVVNGLVVIDAVASADVSTLQTDLEALGMQGAVTAGRFVSGRFPILAIDALAALASLQFVRPAYASTHVGLVTSQGDQAMRSDVARANFGVNGAGVTVGVLSDSFNCLGGAAADVANNDLSPVAVLQDEPGCSSGTDEGRAMLQLVHDVAPGADLAFATAFTGQAGFANNILALQAAGAGVIVDDVIFFAEPMFQDGIIAQAVNTVVGMGVPYFSSAGNDARRAYQSAFNPGPILADGSIPSAPGAPHFFGGTAHDINPGAGVAFCQQITIPANSSFNVSFQWDSPFFSVSGAPGTPNDVDIYLLDASCTQILAGSNDDNVGGDAVEVFGVTTGAAAFTGNLMIVQFSGAAPNRMKYVASGRGTIDEFATNSGTLYGHANAIGAEAVGAAAFFNTPAFGASPPVLETFSSAGTTPILFTTTGVPTFDPRADKPEIVAPDGTNTTFFSSDIPQDADTFPNFFGTSAAAPHAAAVAALLLEAVPTLTPSSVYTALERTAIDMGPSGFDNDSGFGLIQADLALATVLKPNLTGTNLTDLAVLDTSTFTWYIAESSTGQLRTAQFGYRGTIPVPNDYDGDGEADLAVLDTSTFTWYIAESSTGQLRTAQFGYRGTTPVPNDYDGDGEVDLAVLDTSTFTWYIAESSTGQLRTAQFGYRGTTPVPNDYDGDGEVDLAVLDTSTFTWYIAESSTGQLRTAQFGYRGTIPVPNDYDGDGEVDLAVLDTSTFTWYIAESSTGQLRTAQFGYRGTIPVPNDYDGDGEADLAVLDTSTFTWYIAESSTGQLRTAQFGYQGTTPVPDDYD